MESGFNWVISGEENTMTKGYRSARSLVRITHPPAKGYRPASIFMVEREDTFYILTAGVYFETFTLLVGWMCKFKVALNNIELSFAHSGTTLY